MKLKKILILSFLFIFAKSNCVNLNFLKSLTCVFDKLMTETDIIVDTIIDESNALFIKNGQKIYFSLAFAMFVSGLYKITQENKIEDKTNKEFTKTIQTRNLGLLEVALYYYRIKKSQFNFIIDKTKGSTLMLGSLVPLFFGYLHKIAYKG